MALASGSHVEMALVMSANGNQAINTWDYTIGDFPGTPNAGQLAQAWWNDVKALYRACVVVEWGNVFLSVRCRELDSATGAYGEYAIPLSESVGTRTGITGPLLSPFDAGGIRLVVSTRVTKPGQKRIPCLSGQDVNVGYIQPAYKTLINALATHMTGTLVMGAPAALSSLQPIVVRKDAHGIYVLSQPITGALVNPYGTTQNSRKYGRGA